MIYMATFKESQLQLKSKKQLTVTIAKDVHRVSSSHSSKTVDKCLGVVIPCGKAGSIGLGYNQNSRAVQVHDDEQVKSTKIQVSIPAEQCDENCVQLTFALAQKAWKTETFSSSKSCRL